MGLDWLWVELWGDWESAAGCRTVLKLCVSSGLAVLLVLMMELEKKRHQLITI